MFFANWTMLVFQLAFCLLLHPPFLPPPSFSISSPYPVKLYFQIAWQKTHQRAVTSAGPLGPAVTSAPAARGEMCISPAASPRRSDMPQPPAPKINEPYSMHSYWEGRTNVCRWVRGRCSPVEWSETKKKNVERRKQALIKKKIGVKGSFVNIFPIIKKGKSKPPTSMICSGGRIRQHQIP